MSELDGSVEFDSPVDTELPPLELALHAAEHSRSGDIDLSERYLETALEKAAGDTFMEAMILGMRAELRYSTSANSLEQLFAALLDFRGASERFSSLNGEISVKNGREALAKLHAKMSDDPRISEALLGDNPAQANYAYEQTLWEEQVLDASELKLALKGFKRFTWPLRSPAEAKSDEIRHARLMSMADGWSWSQYVDLVREQLPESQIVNTEVQTAEQDIRKLDWLFPRGR